MIGNIYFNHKPSLNKSKKGMLNISLYIRLCIIILRLGGRVEVLIMVITKPVFILLYIIIY